MTVSASRDELATLEHGHTLGRAQTAISDDLVWRADGIADELGTKARLIYHLFETTDIPIFKLGGKLCARKSALRAWIERQEARSSD